MECNSANSLWRIFRGCGHSVHVESNLPNISVCSICQSTIKSKVETVGKTANDAVKNFAKEDDESDDDGESSDDDGELHYVNSDEEDSIEDIAIDISRFGSWTQVLPPRT